MPKRKVIEDYDDPEDQEEEVDDSYDDEEQVKQTVNRPGRPKLKMEEEYDKAPTYKKMDREVEEEETEEVQEEEEPILQKVKQKTAVQSAQIPEVYFLTEGEMLRELLTTVRRIEATLRANADSR